MNDAKKLLDSLMGLHRNADRKVMNKKRGNQFKEDTICKHYLAGFCPKHEELFVSTKRDIGTCDKVHSDLMREELDAHPDGDRYKGEYERKLKTYLEELVRMADDWVARERRNLAESNRQLEESGPNETAKVEIKKLYDMSAALLNEAENWAEKGSIEESKERAEQAEELKRKAQDWEEKARSERKDDICEICGSRKESQVLNVAGFRHEEGKVHLGYVKIREWLAIIRQRVADRNEKEREEEKAKMKEREARRKERKERDRSRSRDRRGGRDKDRDKEKPGEGEKGAEANAPSDDKKEDREGGDAAGKEGDDDKQADQPVRLQEATGSGGRDDRQDRRRRDDRDREAGERRRDDHGSRRDDRDADRRRGRDDRDGDERRRRRDDEYDDRDRDRDRDRGGRGGRDGNRDGGRERRGGRY